MEGVIGIGTNLDDEHTCWARSSGFPTPLVPSTTPFCGQKWPKLALNVTFSDYLVKYHVPSSWTFHGIPQQMPSVSPFYWCT